MLAPEVAALPEEGVVVPAALAALEAEVAGEAEGEHHGDLHELLELGVHITPPCDWGLDRPCS